MPLIILVLSVSCTRTRVVSLKTLLFEMTERLALTPWQKPEIWQE